MFEKVIIFFIVFFAVILQMSAFPNLFFLGAGPNIVLILIIFWTVHEGFEAAFFKIILAGFILDLASFHFVGVNILVFSLIAFLSSSFSRRFLVAARNWRTIILVFLIIVSTFLNDLLLFALFRLVAYFKGAEANSIIFSTNWIILGREMLLNTLFFFLISFPLMKIERILNLHKSKKNLNYV